MSVPSLMARLFIAISAGMLASAYWLGGYLPVSLIALGLAISGLLFLQRGWSWVVSLLLALNIGVAATGFYLELSPALLVSGALSALAGWDLEYFARRLKNAGRVIAQPSLVWAHLLRLLWVSLLGLVLFGISYLIHLHFTFGLAVLLALLAVLGLSQGIGFLRRAGN
jgi:hypothetical protein